MRIAPERNENSSLDPNLIEIDSALVRDYFAGLVLQRLVAHTLSHAIADIGDIKERLCDQAYSFADAMLERRLK